uniref:Uncharacterized protein n=1 Tax=Anguilla anguilla TaxID=7936 RepID=A0A0E9RUE0_ANGAN
MPSFCTKNTITDTQSTQLHSQPNVFGILLTRIQNDPTPRIRPPPSPPPTNHRSQCK